MLIRQDTLVPWKGEALNGIKHPKNIEALWSIEDLAAVGLVKAIRFVVPDGYHTTGVATYDTNGQETLAIEITAPPTAEEIADEIEQQIAHLVRASQVRDKALMALAKEAGLAQSPALYTTWLEGLK